MVCSSKDCRVKTAEKFCTKCRRKNHITKQYLRGEISNNEIYRFWQDVDKFVKLR